MKVFPRGVWPVMVTPFRQDGTLDSEGLRALVDWYISQGCNGLFAVCQSSEMFFLSLKERVHLARLVIQSAAGRLPIVVSGHVSAAIHEQARELCSMADTGADGLVLVANRLVECPEDSDLVFRSRLKQLLSQIPSDIPLGFYECPYPFKRLLSPDILKFCLDSGRFRFIKDTSCDIDNIQEKLTLLSGSEIKLYNANTATLLSSLLLGVDGYSGVMANFHPALYHWLVMDGLNNLEEAQKLQEILSMCALIELKKYPACAKRYLRRQHHLPIRDVTRKDASQPVFFMAEDTEFEQLYRLSERWQQHLDSLRIEPQKRIAIIR